MTRLLLAIMALLISHQALAQQQRCAPRQVMLAGLLATYGEVPFAEGIMETEGRPSVPVIFLARLGGTWTVIATPNSVIACFLMKGSGFDIPTPEKPRGFPL